MSSFSVGGLATGLDTKSIISQLMSIESRPKMQLEWKSSLWSARKSAWSDLNTRLLSLQTLSNTLLRPETWDMTALPPGAPGAWGGTSGDPSGLTASVTGTPTAGTYGIDVLQIARGEISLSGGILSPPTAGSRATGFWYEGAANVVEGNENITALRTSGGTLMGFNTNSNIAMNYTVNGVAQTATFKVNTVALGGQGTTLTEFNAWVASTIGNGATSAWGAGADAGKLIVTTAPGTANELTNLTFNATNAAGTALTNFNTSVSAGSATAVAATNGDVLGAADTLTIANGAGSWNVALAAGDNKQAIVNKINATSGINVFASLVGSNIQLRSTAMGAAAAFTVSSTGSTATQLGFNETQSAQDAFYTVDGTSYSSAVNTNVAGAIVGISLNLLNTTSTTLTVAQGAGASGSTQQDKWVDATKAKIQEFVTAYNAVLDLVHQKTQGESKVASPKNLQEYLQGSMARDVGFSQVGFDLRRLSMDKVSGLPAATNMLSQIGIDTSFAIGAGGANGKLVINDTELDAALRTDPTGVQNVLTNIGAGAGTTADDGIIRRISEQVSLMRVGGRVDNALSGASTQIKGIQDAIDRQDHRLGKRKAYYERMFSSLETTIGRMQSQNAWVSSQFAQMSSGMMG